MRLSMYQHRRRRCRVRSRHTDVCYGAIVTPYCISSVCKRAFQARQSARFEACAGTVPAPGDQESGLTRCRPVVAFVGSTVTL